MEEASLPIETTPKIIERIEEKKFNLMKNNNIYILSIIKTNNDSIIFNLNIDSKFSINYYELDYESKLLRNLSKLFKFCSNLDEYYSVLLENLEKNNIEIEFLNDKAKLFFKISLPTKKEENVFLILNKKTINLNELLDKLKSKINDIEEGQLKLEKNVEKKIIRINEIISKYNNLENTINEIDKFKNFYTDIDKTEKNNKINEIEKNFDNMILELDNINKLNNEKKLIKEEEENIREIIKKIPSIIFKINLIKDYQKKIRYRLNENDSLFNEMNSKLINCQNIIERNNEEIKIIKDNQKKTKNYIEEENNEINSIKLNNSGLNKKGEIKELKNGNLKNILEEIEKLHKENLELKNAIEENDEKIQTFNELLKEKKDLKESDKELFTKEDNKDLKINELDIKEDIKDVKKTTKKDNLNNPNEFKFYKTISSDLFSNNFYNNRACIFCSKEDNNIYVAYGVLSLNLECYDIINDKKFILIEKIHKDIFNSCRYFYDEKNKRDLLFTTSLDAHVKVIHFKKENSKIIVDLNFESEQEVIINTSILFFESILVPFSKLGTVKLYTFNLEYIGELEQNAEFILGLSKYYSKKKKRNFALIANRRGIFAYYLSTLRLYKQFFPPLIEEEKEKYLFDEAYAIEKDYKEILIGPRFYFGYLHLWDFIKGDLIDTIKINSGISDICIWNNKYIFSSLNNEEESQFALINLNNKEVEKFFLVDKKDSKGSGIKVLKNKSKGTYLISYSLSGKLDLYKLDKKCL